MRPVHARARTRHASTLVTAFALTLAGCGGGADEAADAKPADAAAAPAPASAPAAQPAAAPAVDGTGTPAPEGEMAVMDTLSPFQVPIEGPIEYEEGVEGPLVATFPEPAAEPSRPAIDDLPPDDPLLGKPLVINGVVVPFEEVKKQICLGSSGVAEIKNARMLIFIKEEQQRLAEAGVSLDAFEVGSDDVNAFVSRVEEEIKREYPEGELSIDDVFSGLVSDDPREKLRIQMTFERYFMPDNPAEWPPVTLEAILKEGGGQAVLDTFKQSYDERHKTDPPTEKDEAMHQLYAAHLGQIHEHLISIAAIQPDPEPGVLYRVNGADITVEEIWNAIRSRITTMEVLAAKQWIVNTTLLKEALVAAGAWLTDEEAYNAYHQHSDPFKGSMFSQESVALMLKQFPSIERYRQHRHIYDSFARYRNPSPEVLKEYADKRTNHIIGQVSVDVDVILCSAYDFKTNRWKENGWVEAENRMKDVLKLLVEDQRPWEELVERYSDFYEPPMPVSLRGQVDPNAPRKGRFRNIQRNNLLGHLGEHDYGIFLNGTCVTDFIFFEQTVGTVGTPMRGPAGWYLPRLIRRTKPPKRIPMDEETQRELVLDDYLSNELARFAQELIAKNEVYGLELPGT